MSIARETAIEYLRVAIAALEREDDREGLYHIDKAQSLLLRPLVEPRDNDSASAQITAH